MAKKQSLLKKYSAQDGQAAASKFGQLIGNAFAQAIYNHIREYVARRHSEYQLLAPKIGEKLVRLAMPGGTTYNVPENSDSKMRQRSVDSRTQNAKHVQSRIQGKSGGRGLARG